MFDDLKLELRWNFKVPHVLGVVILLEMPKSKSSTNFLSFSSKKAKFRCLVI
jgi:hypothetical protein